LALCTVVSAPLLVYTQYRFRTLRHEKVLANDKLRLADKELAEARTRESNALEGPGKLVQKAEEARAAAQALLVRNQTLQTSLETKRQAFVRVQEQTKADLEKRTEELSQLRQAADLDRRDAKRLVQEAAALKAAAQAAEANAASLKKQAAEKAEKAAAMLSEAAERKKAVERTLQQVEKALIRQGYYKGLQDPALDRRVGTAEALAALGRGVYPPTLTYAVCKALSREDDDSRALKPLWSALDNIDPELVPHAVVLRRKIKNGDDIAPWETALAAIEKRGSAGYGAAPLLQRRLKGILFFLPKLNQETHAFILRNAQVLAQIAPQDPETYQAISQLARAQSTPDDLREQYFRILKDLRGK
jgi:hypothetical protein